MSEFAVLQEMFTRFSTALRAGDESSFLALCDDGAPLEAQELLALFRHNSAKARAETWTLKLREVVEEGPRASLGFEVRREGVSERAQLEAERREGRWVLTEL